LKINTAELSIVYSIDVKTFRKNFKNVKYLTKITKTFKKVNVE